MFFWLFCIGRKGNLYICDFCLLLLMGRHFHIVNFSLSKQLAETYLCVFLRNFAIALIGIFLPIYLFKELSYSFREVLLFFIIMQFCAAFFAPFIAKINASWGCKHTILLSVPFTLLFFMTLDILKDVHFLFYLIPVVGGVAESMYWMAFHVNFAKSTNYKHRGEQVTIWYVMSILLGVIGPLVGALILTFLNFSILFVLVAILLVASAIPLFSSKEVFSRASFSIKYIFNRKRVRDAFAFFGYGTRHMAGAILWPFFIFFIVKEYFNLGLVISVASIFTALITWLFIGRIIDSHSKRRFISWGSFIDSIISILRIFPKNVLHVLGLTTLGAVAYDLVDVPFSAKMYNKAQVDTLGYITFRAVFAHLGRVFIMAVPLVASYYVDPFAPYEAIKYAFIALVPLVYLQRLL